MSRDTDSHVELTSAVDPNETRGAAADLELLAALNGYGFPETMVNTALAFRAAYAALVLVEDGGLWFCSRQGFPEASTPRDGILWDLAMASEGPLVFDDLLADPRFAGGAPLVGGIEARFFVTCVFHSQDGRPLGVYCLASPEPGHLDASELQNLVGLVGWIERELAGIRELDRAAEVQRALLPKRVPPLEGYQVAGMCLPAKAVGGDFYDWYEIEGGVAFTLADAMGKGVGASIIAATVRATLRSAREDEDVLTAVERTSKTLAEDLSEAGSFVTLFHARLRAALGDVWFVDAGHGLSVLVDADGTARRLSSGDLPLGTTFGDDWRPQQVSLEEGGTLVVFSDGVLDLFDGTLGSVDRVADIARTASSAQAIVDELERIARRDTAPDDVTVIAIRRTAHRTAA